MSWTFDCEETDGWPYQNTLSEVWIEIQMEKYKILKINSIYIYKLHMLY